MFSSADGVVLAHRADEAEETHAFFEAVAAEQGWVPPQGAIKAYPKHSIYFIHKSLDDRLLGAVKLVMGNKDEGLPILGTWPELPLAGRVDVAELSIIALAPEARGRGSSFLPLSAELWRHSVLAGVQELWAELEPRMVNAYRRFGWPCEVAGELRDYWGDPLYPCRVRIEEAWASYVEKAAKQEKYRRALEQSARDTPYQSWL